MWSSQAISPRASPKGKPQPPRLLMVQSWKLGPDEPRRSIVAESLGVPTKQTWEASGAGWQGLLGECCPFGRPGYRDTLVAMAMVGLFLFASVSLLTRNVYPRGCGLTFVWWRGLGMWLAITPMVVGYSLARAVANQGYACLKRQAILGMVRCGLGLARWLCGAAGSVILLACFGVTPPLHCSMPP